ncbi:MULTISPECIES: putative Ig domain-containing protein [Pseudanabaena]|uniref:RHS repeat-associated core domain protein n=2 Tax=Pseudanabaena TaxID=1152 RepID=L8MXW6_9CYAN|nr:MULTISPECIES: putative Ig domain-containing protein [Pseudanabaena]ELS32847.1 RHS repeat-associated core domain protein [Pseudanabaena biceps PCC 7429]MDG3494923.1 putative Ig domain-containing protein [Pseudanabaena catenata USMAC16]
MCNALNTDIIGSIAEKGEQDYYRFEGKAGQVLFFDDLGSSSGIYATLYDPNGRYTGFQISQGDGNPNDSAGLRLTSDGTYLISIDGSGETTGTYGFRLLNMADSPLVALNTDITGTFDNSDRGSVGYRFNLAERTYIYVDGQLGDGYWNIYNASGQRVTGNYTNADQELWLGTGEYWLVAQGTGNTDTDYKLKIITPDLLATPLALNGVVTGSISTKGEQDYYTFTGIAGDKLFLDALGSSPNLSFYITDPFGRNIYSTGNISDAGPDTNNTSLLLTKNGTYTITIDGNGEVTGNYKFRILSDSSSPLISIGDIIQGTFDNGGVASNGYRFNVSTTQTIHVDIQNGQSPNYWIIYGGDGQVVARQNFPNSADVNLTKGEYWLVAIGNSSADNTYKLQINSSYLASSNDPTPIPYIPNTTISGTIASSIVSPILNSNNSPVPYTVTASSEYYGYYPAYRAFDGSLNGSSFWATNGEPNPFIQIDLGTPTTVSGYSFVSRADGEYNQSPRWWVLSGSNDGTTFTSLDSRSGQPVWGVGEKREYALATADNYRYYRWTYTTEGAIGQNIISIQEIQLLNSIVDSKKIYSFDATSGQSFKFDGLSLGSNLKYSIIDPNGKLLISNAKEIESSKEIFASETGTYKLIIDSATKDGGSYRFNLVPTPSTPIPYSLNTTVSGTIAGSVVSPILTSNVASPYKVTASSEYFPAYFAFDGRTNNSNGYAMWHTNGEPNPFIQIDLGTSTSISGYSFVSRADGEYNQSPRQWVFAGSNDGINFTTLDSKSGQPIWGTGEKRSYALGETDSYRYYKWSLTAQSSIGQSYLCIQEIQLLNSVSTGDTKKVYSFDATAGQGLYFDSLTSNSALQYSIIDPKGRTLVKQGNLTSDRGEIFIGETGTYQLIIDASGGYAGNYSFNLVPYGNSSTIATPVTLGSNLSGTFGADGREAKFYRFTANANQLLAIDPSGDSNTYWFIYSPKGDTVASGRLSKYKEFFLNQTGEYTLVIAGNGAANNSYQLNLLAPSTTTTPLAIGTDISGNISTKGQYDSYTFTGKAGQQLFYDALGGDNYLYVTVYDPTGRRIVDRANNTSDRNLQDGLILQMNGTYTLQIGGSDYYSYYDLYETSYPTTSPYTTHTGNYKFRLLDKADATAVNVGDYITGTFDNGALGSKLYKLSLTETKALYFDGLQGDGTFRIYNSNGYEITNLNLNDGYDRELTLGVGEYLIVMQGRGSASNYQLRISQPPAYLNVPIDFDTVISDSITDKGAKRYYSFNGKAGKQIYFDGLGGNFGNNLVIYDPTGRVVFNQNPQYDATSSQELILQMDGVYQIVIDSSSHYYYDYSYVYPYLGDYKFRLLDKDNATVVNVGNDITGTFDNGALGSKAYKLTLTETKFLYFDGMQGNGVFHLYSPNGQEITSLGLNDGHDREFNLGAGEYLIVMQGNGNDPNYKLHISEPIILPTESIDLGAVVSGNISEKGVKRSFTFTGVAGHQLFYDALGSDYSFVAIYDPNGRRVFFQDGRYDYNPYDGSGSYSNLVNNSTGLILQMNGTYTVVIDASDHDYYRYYASQYDYVVPQLGNYKFRLLDKVLAPETTLDTVVSGLPDNNGLGTTQYRLNISERKYVYFDAQGGSGNWIIYSPDGKTRVASSELNRSQEFWLDAGEYTIAIQGVPQGSNTVPYQFKIVTPDLISTAYKVGDTISGSISEKGEKDFYTFEGKPGQRLFFDGLSTTANIYATLTSPTGKTIFSRLDTQSNYANEVLDENGIYTLTIDGSSYDYYGNVSLGNYSLRLLEYANASSFATSQAVLVQTNTDITGSLSDANGKQSNLYRFTGTQGQTLYIDTIAGDTSNFWGIYAPNGTSVTYGNLSTPGEIVLSQTGEYTLEVQGRGASNRDYTIRLITPNSSIANYTLGNVISTSLARKGETDTYSFTGNLGQRLFFDSITAPPNVRARLYSPTDILLKDSLLSEGEWLPETLAETGKYRLVIDGDGGAIGNYSFSLSDRAIASEISLATSISGTIAANSANLYKLNGKQGQVLSFDLTAPNLVGASWVIYDPSGIAIATPSSASPDFKVALASTGIYSLVINGSSGGEYSFQVTDITPAAVANSGIGVVQTVSINNAGATVDYEFTGKAGTQIFFDAQAYDSSNSYNNYYYGGYDYYSYYYSRFRLINPDGTVAQDNQSAVSDQVLTLSQTGTYRLQAYSAYPYAASNFRYNLLEMPNSFGSPTLNYLALNDTVTGTLNNKETKIYTFQNSVGTKVLFNGMYGDGVNAYLYDPSGRVVMSLGVNSSDSAPYTLTQEGLYHLAISGQANTYSGSLQRSYSFQLLDASTAQEVEYNLPITGSLDNGEKGTFYKITAEANKILYFDNLSFNTNWYYPYEYRWTLYGAGNNVIASNELRNDFEVKIDKAGEYYLYVAGAYATNPVDYKFRVVATDISNRRDVIVPGSGISGAKNDDGSLATVAVELQAKDGKGGTATQNYDIKLFADPNNANPVITSIPDTKYSLAEDGYRYQVKSLDPDSDSLVYRLINSPIGAVINRDTGELLWFPSASVVPGSKANFTVEVSDGRGGKDTQTFTVDVYGNLGKIQGAVFDDLNGNGLLDSKLIKGDNPSVVLAIDVSGSTAAPFLGTGKFKDVKTVLDAEVAAIKSLISSIIAQGQGSKLKIGFLPFTTGATIQDMDLVMAGLQEYTTALADSNGNGTSNISEVLALPLYHIPDGGSTLNNVIEQIDTLVNVLPGTPNLIFMSDGYFSNLNPTEINTIVANIKSRGGNVTAFGIGEAATTNTLKAIDPDAIKLIDINELSNIFTGFDERYALEPFKENVSVYLDLNNDGQYEAGEPTQLTKRGNAPNSVGQTPYYYTFDHLTPGNYTVRILTPNGYSLSTPDTGFATDVVTTAGETFSHLFGVTKIATPVNTAPQFTTIPPELTQLKAGQLLTYKAKAIDPDADSVTYSLVLAPKGMTVDNETGTVIWNPTKTQIADYYAQLEADRQRVGPSRAAAIAKTPVFNVLLRAQDGKGGQALQYIKVELLADNQAPVFTSIFPSTTPQANKAFQYQVNALDPNNDTVTFSLVTAPSGATINASTGLLTWQPTSNQVGDNNFTIKVTDGKGGESLQTGKLSVINAVPNRAPTISSNPRNSARYGNSYSYEILATDADGDALTYSLVTAPAGMTIKDNILSWLPSSSQFGDNNVSVKVTDTQGASSIQTFQIRVGSQLENKAPTISSAPNLVTTIDREYQYDLSGSDPNGDRLLWSLDKAPTGMVIDATTGRLRWQPTVNQIGEQAIAIRVSDNYGAYSVQEYTLKVNAINTAPNILSTPITKAGQGQPYVYNVVATDAENDAIRYSLISYPTGMSIDSETGKISWTPSYSNIGSYKIQVQATDSKGIFNTQTYQLEIVAAPNLNAINHTPSITSTPITQIDTTKPYRYQVVATDVDAGDSLSYGLINGGGATGITINPTTGLVTWDSPTLGTYNIEIGVTDSSGARATQGFTLNVSNQPSSAASNKPPQIVSTPITRIGQGQAYSYEVLARDPENNPVIYSLKSSPNGMAIDANTGKISWTGNIVGSYNVEVQATDSQGGFSSQSYQLEVIANPINHAPSITSTPQFQADTNSSYRYQVTASDPDAGDKLEYQLISNGGATGLAIDRQTGLLTGNNLSAGNYKVVIGVVDEGGLGAAQGFTLTARANQLPVIISDNPPTAVPNIPYVYDLRVSDPDGGSLKYSLDDASKNLGISIDELGRLRWTPSVNQIGAHPITISITDESGGVISQNFTINVQADSTAPSVKLTYAGSIPAAKGSAITFQVQATDDVKVSDLQLLVDGQAVPLDNYGIATVVLNKVGNIQIVAKAIDVAGNVGQDTTVSIPVFDPNAEAHAPEVSFQLFGIEDAISSLSDIKGLVDDPDDNLQSYVVDIAAVGTDDWTTIITGNSEVNAGGVLGKFDPSIFADDSYRIRLTATDTTGLSSSVEEQVNVVSGGLKLGNFTLSFTDLSIPISGIPINVTRTYDSLNAKVSDDFGYGWRLEFRDTDLRTSLAKDEVYEQTGLRTQAFKDGTKVFITLPGGKRETFTFKPTRDPISSYFPAIDGYDASIYHPAFTSEKGSTSTLTVVDTKLSYIDGKYYSLGSGVAYNPADGYFGNKYILTTKEGIVYEIDGTTGDLNTVTNPNGNTLTFTDAGITSDTGKAVTFQRDASGRITSVTDPLGQVVKYQYDAKGDLIGVSDRENNTTQFKYAQPTRDHFLTEVVDPLGRSGVKNEYDAQGRLVKLVDALGKPVQLAYDPTNSTQTVTDALGNPTTYVYDQRGNVVSEVDANGGVVSRTYDDQNNLLKKVDADGVTTTYTYDSNGNPLTLTDGDGNTTRMQYNRYSEILNVISPTGLAVSSSYDDRGNLISRTNTDGQTTTFSYDSLGRLISQTAPDGEVSTFEYDRYGNAIGFTDSRGNKTNATYDLNGKVTNLSMVFPTENQTLNISYTYDKAGRVTSITDPQGNVSRTEYDANVNVTATIDIRGNRTEYFYDEKGQQIKVILPDNTPNNAADNPVLLTEYDAVGRVISKTSATGLKTHYEYDALGQLTDTIFADLTPNDNSDNPREHIEYTASGRIKATIDIFGNRTEYTYDALGRISQERDFFGNPIGNDTTYTYNTGGQVTSVTDAKNRTTQIGLDAQGRSSVNTYFDGTTSNVVYDALGRVKSETNQLGQTTSYEYDAFGKVSAMIDALNQRTQFTYNSRGSLVKVTDALGHETQYEYDQYNRRTAVIDGNGNRTETTYDQFGQAIAIKDANLHTTEYAYNNLGELTAVKLANQATTIYGYDNLGRQTLFEDANGNKTTYEYDAFNRKVATNLALGQRSTTIFNNFGQVAKTTDFNGNVITYAYDLYGRLANKSFSDPRVATVGYTYDPVTSQIKTVTDGRGVTTYSFDSYDRVNLVASPDGQTVGYSYDVLGNLKTLTTAANTVNYAYDKLNRLDTVTSGIQLAKYSYDAAGNLIGTVLADGTTEADTYDAANRLTGMVTRDSSGAVLSSYAYTLDGVGNRTKVVENNGRTVNYAYDVLNQLQSESMTDPILGNRTIAYEYDSVGNRLKRNDSDPASGVTTYIYDANNRLKNTTNGNKVTNFTYDNNGSTLTKYDGTNTVVYDWINDGENRLVGVTSTNNGVTSQSNYIYDANGNRVASITDGVRKNYLLDSRGNAKVLQESDVNGQILNKYTFGLGLIKSEGGGNTRFYHSDGLGSTRLLTDASGQVTDRYVYDAYGKLIASAGNSSNSFQFAGEQRDGTGLDYLRARYYDSDLGRFISKDAFGGRMSSPISKNPYAYANNNPINFTDPSGYDALGATESTAIIGILSSIAYASVNVASFIVQAALRGAAFEATHFVIIVAGAFVVQLLVPDSAADGTLPSSFTEKQGGFDPNDINFGKDIDSVLRDLAYGYPLPDGDFNPNDDFDPNSINTNKGRDSNESWRDLIETFPSTNGGFSPNDINFGKDLGGLLLPHIFLSVKDVIIDSNKYPESAQHVRDAQASGYPEELTIDRSGASKNRKDSLRGIDTVSGKDRDEYPPAVFQEGGSGSSVRPINPSDNRGAGSTIGHQIKDLPDGTKVRIVVDP